VPEYVSTEGGGQIKSFSIGIGVFTYIQAKHFQIFIGAGWHIVLYEKRCVPNFVLDKKHPEPY
jgi:hypothetical protein